MRNANISPCRTQKVRVVLSNGFSFSFHEELEVTATIDDTTLSVEAGISSSVEAGSLFARRCPFLTPF